MNNENTTGFSQGAFAPEPRVYELGYLLMPSVDEGDLGTQRDALVAIINRFEGVVVDEGQPVLIDLAYEMDKTINNKRHTYNQAYFGWIKFDVSPHDIEELTNEVEKVKELIRSITVKTVKENTVTSEQPFRVAKVAQDSERTEDLTDKEINTTEDTVEEKKADDDLTKIEGIGPVIAKTLAEGGIASFKALADSQDEDVQEIIKDVRGSHDGSTWNEQAALAADGKWDELKELQDSLNGGVEEK